MARTDPRQLVAIDDLLAVDEHDHVMAQCALVVEHVAAQTRFCANTPSSTSRTVAPRPLRSGTRRAEAFGVNTTVATTRANVTTIVLTVTVFDAVVAADREWGIGKANALPWPKLKGDLAHFKRVTSEARRGPAQRDRDGPQDLGVAPRSPAARCRAGSTS